VLSPLLETRKSRNPQSLYNPSRFEICIYKPEKRCLYLHIPKRKIPTVDPPIRRGKTVGIFNAAFIGTKKFMRHMLLQQEK
jgi:hypothetical protein